MNLSNKNVMVVGTGISGIGAVNLLNRAGLALFFMTVMKSLNKSDIEKKLDGSRAQIIIGKLDDNIVENTDLLVISPGVPIDSELVLKFKECNVPVWGEIELAFNFDKGRVVAITGTNGKTTTTALVGEIVKAYEAQTFVVGNIGNPYTKEVLRTSEKSYTVAEISSFQLESVHKIHPVVSADT